jgi:glycosyltransferase involved in cell wall biosynthesis
MNPSKKNSKVSVLLPVFNGERYLVEAIESVLSQSYGNWELVISDNCSQDATEDIARDFADRDNRIKYFRNNQNVGFACNYNSCIERSSGDYLELFGADDVFEPTCLERLAGILDGSDNIALVTCSRMFIDAKSMVIDTHRPINASRIIPAEEAIGKFFESLSNWIISPVMYRTSSKRSGLDTRLRMYCDIDYWMRVLEDGDAFYLDESLFRYRVHHGSESTRLSLEFEDLLDLLRFIDKNKEKVARAVRPVEGIEGPPTIEHLIGDRLLAVFNHSYRYRGERFEELLHPAGSTIAGGSKTKVGAVELGVLEADRHDFRRALFYALLHSSELRLSIEKLQANLCSAKLTEEDLRQQIHKSRAKLTNSKVDLESTVKAHHHAVSERDRLIDQVSSVLKLLEAARQENIKVAEEFNRLSEESMRVIRERDNMKMEAEYLRGQLTLSRDEKEELLKSQSWRLTAPLRSLRQRIQRGVGTSVQ